MSNISILIAEDDLNIRTGLVDTLESEGYRVTTASDGKEALDLFEKNSFHLVLLDVMMPEKSGYDVCREIRLKDPDTPVIMLTAKGEEIDKVVGLQLGADDYITKPFGVHELLARISAVLRRCQRNHSQNNNSQNNDLQNKQESYEILIFGGLEVHARRYKIIRENREFDLSDRELKLIHFFSKHPDEVLSRDRILNEVWGIDYFGTTRTLDQHVAQLRKKIEIDPANPVIITTVHGVGYRYRYRG